MNAKTLAEIGVIAFVGAAGTGKSERALAVARAHAVDFIIDDGLVVARGQIMAGVSAKSEKNMVRAIRRAIFHDKEHREAVRKFLVSKSPCRVLILATSDEMVGNIVKALSLPNPEKTLYITEISTQKEIESALRERRENRQHAIPVSHAQIQRSFAGKLVRQIKGMFNWGKSDPRTIVKPPFSFSGGVTIEEDALYALARYLLNYGECVKKIKDLKIESSADGSIVIHAVINIASAPAGMNVLGIAKVLQRKLRRGLGYFTGIEIRKANIEIDEVSFNNG